MTRIDLEQTCVSCKNQFWLMSIGDQVFDYICESRGRGLADAQIQQALVNGGWPRKQIESVFRRLAVDRCRRCRNNPGSGKVSSALATLEQVRADNGDGALGPLLPDPLDLFGDIQQLAAEASAPIEYRRRTFLEWWQGLDLEAIQIEKKLQAGSHADQLLRQRLAFIRQCQEIAKTTHEARTAAMAHRQAELRAHLEELKLQEEIVRQQALQDERIKTQQLEEARKQALILAELEPPPSPEPPKDPAQEMIAEYRSHAQTRAAAKQALISDFLHEVRGVYDADVDDTEKALRIRAVLEAYKQDFEALPPDVRHFIDLLEKRENSP